MQHKKLILHIFVFAYIFINFNANVKAVTATYSTTNTNTYAVTVDLNDCKLFLIDTSTNKIIKSYNIAGGKQSTPSPVGTWKITDKGIWTKAFGTRWMGINVPWGRYGIHGTNKPYSIGSPSSQGCIRMRNRDVEDLYSKLSIGTTVVIYGGPYSILYNTPRHLVPGNVGPDVLEIQKRLKEKGYYDGKLNGIYNDFTEKAVFSFKKDHKLPLSNEVNYQMYRYLDIVPFE